MLYQETANFTLATVGVFGLHLREVRWLAVEFLERKPASAGLAVRLSFVERGKRKTLTQTFLGSAYAPFLVVLRGHKLPLVVDTFERSAIPGGMTTRYGSYDPRWTADANEAISDYIERCGGALPYLDLRGLDLHTGRNREGLTWAEWLAATQAPDSIVAEYPQVYRFAWIHGEDPTEHNPGAKS